MEAFSGSGERVSVLYFIESCLNLALPLKINAQHRNPIRTTQPSPLDTPIPTRVLKPPDKLPP